MAIYYLTILYLWFSGLLLEVTFRRENRRIRLNPLIILAFVVLVSQMGFRWETGTDWSPYINSFKDLVKNTSWLKYENDQEVGYNIISKIFVKTFDSYTFFLLFQSIFFYVLIF